MGGYWLRTGLAVVLALVTTVALLGHYVFPLDSFPAREGQIDQDCFQGVWNLWYAAKAIASGKNPFEAPELYYPLGSHLAHHTLSPGYAPFTWIVEGLSARSPRSPLYAFRLLPLLGFTLSLFFTERLLGALGFGASIRWTLAISYAFSRLQVHHLIHPNYVAGGFVPLWGWQLVELARAPSRRRALLLACLLALGVYFTELTLYGYLAILLLLAVLCVSREVRDQLHTRVRALGVKTLVGSLVLYIALIAPYATALWHDEIIRPDPREAVQYSSNLLGFVVPTREATPLYGTLFASIANRVSAGIGGSEAFLGFVPILLTLCGLIFARNRRTCVAASLAGIFLVLSLGPVLNVLSSETAMRMPYSLLGRMPIFDAGRTPVRFVAIAAIFMIVAAADGMAWITKSMASHRQRFGWVTSALLLGWVLAESVVPPTEKIRLAPLTELQRMRPGPVLNLPPREKDGYAAFLQTLHGQPIATGYTARISMQRLRHIRALRRLFDRGGPAFWAQVGELGFRTVIITPREITAPNSPSMVPLGPAPPGITVIDLRGASAGGLDCDAGAQARPVAVPGRVEFMREASSSCLCFGWGDVESNGRWTIRGRSGLRVAGPNATPVRLRLRAEPFLVPGKIDRQRLGIELDGRALSQWEIRDPQSREYSCEIAAGQLRADSRLDLVLPDADAPLYLGAGADRRTLGVLVEWLSFEVVE